jgi:hypothetical protein
MPRLKVALLFSGQPRCIDGLSYDSIRTCLLDRYDVDVFAHFWGDLETDKTTGTVAANLDRFTELYSPKAIRVDPPLRADEFPLAWLQPHSPVPLTHENILTLKTSNWASRNRNCISMYTSMARVYEVFKAHGGTYDWILRIRTDCVLLRCPQLEALDNTLLYAPQWHELYRGLLVNHTLLTGPDLAQTLFTVRTAVEHLPGVCDEEFLFHHLRTQGVLSRVRTLPLDTFYPTLTRTGTETDHPEPTLTSKVVPPPYRRFVWKTSPQFTWSPPITAWTPLE